MELNWSRLTLIPILIAQIFARGRGESCSETWCNIQPARYSTIEVSEENPGNITCTIPKVAGSTVRFLNHKGQKIFPSAQSSNISQFVQHRFEQNTDGTSNYYLNITWTGDRYVQEQLKVIQCIANFLGIERPCRTSLVNVNFATADQESELPITTKSEEKVTQSLEEIESLKMDNSSTSHSPNISASFLSLVLFLFPHLFIR